MMYYLYWASYLARGAGKGLVVIFGPLLLIPILLAATAWQASKLLYYGTSAVFLTIFTSKGRLFLDRAFSPEKYEDGEVGIQYGGRNDRHLEDGFNIDLDRDFMGAAKTRNQAATIGKAL